MRTAFKVLTVNLIVGLVLFLLLELGYRTVQFAGSCMARECQSGYWRFGSKFIANVDVGLSKRHDVLGHVPDDGRHVIRTPDVGPITVTIKKGLRGNGADIGTQPGTVTLAVGDSFTFGDDVSDADTWPACLERRWRAPVLNGGVFGYGAAQAVLRAQELERQFGPDRIIWSILVEHDFRRDRLVSRSSIPRPAVLLDGDTMRFSSIEESQRVIDLVLSKGIAEYAPAFGYFYVTAIAWQRVSPYLLPAGASYDGRWSVRHPAAAPMPQLMRFSFDMFASLKAAEKYVLLQYTEPSIRMLSAAASDEVELVRKLAAGRDILVIDTLHPLQAAPDLSALYERHHTPAGNRLVCDAIVTAVKKVHREERRASSNRERLEPEDRADAQL
jgi:hypothetical protein